MTHTLSTTVEIRVSRRAPMSNTKHSQDELYPIPNKRQQYPHQQREEAPIHAPYEAVIDRETNMPLCANKTVTNDGAGDDKISDYNGNHGLPDIEP